MESFHILHDLFVVAAVAVVASILLWKVKLPVNAGLLLAGAVAGPSGLGLIADIKEIEFLAEFGVVLLLFTIGLEFSAKRLARIGKMVAVGGSLQVGLTILVVVGVAWFFKFPLNQSIFMGFLIALSSTAIVLRSLSDRGELDAPHGRFIVGTLIFQDLCVVPMVLMIPILAGQGEGNVFYQIGSVFLRVVVWVGVIFVAGRFFIHHIFFWVDKTRSREVFMLAVVAICIGVTWVSALTGLSVALGAFLAGMILSDTDYSHRALNDILPFRDVFTSLFFISLGMLFDLHVVFSHPFGFILLLGIMVLAKGFLATCAAMVMQFPARVAWLAGVGLAQFGEFSFILLKLGREAGLISTAHASIVISSGVVSMFLTPILLRLAPRFTAGEKILRPLERVLGARGMDEPERHDEMIRNHVVVVGYGVAGQILTQALKENKVPYLIMELNADTVRKARAQGEPIYYGDITSQEALQHARAKEAKALVLLINDPDAARRALAVCRKFVPQTPVFLRSRYLPEREELLKLGAHDVVFEEVEAGKEIVNRLLKLMGPADPLTS